jgi:uncharacterized membrane protein
MTQEGDGDTPVKLEKALKPVIQAVLQKGESPEQATADLVRQVTTVVRRHRGPLPDPETLAAYNQLIPNGAERCMGLVEREAAHRHTQEDRLVHTHLGLARDGQRIGAFLVVLLAGLATALGFKGHDWLAGTVFGTTIVAVVTVFVLGRRTIVGHDHEADDEGEPEKVDPADITSQEQASREDVARRLPKQRDLL